MPLNLFEDVGHFDPLVGQRLDGAGVYCGGGRENVVAIFVEKYVTGV